jgi:hypothetical protein
MRFSERRKAALWLLEHAKGLTRKSGSFLGQCAVDQSPLTERQDYWLQQLIRKHGAGS